MFSATYLPLNVSSRRRMRWTSRSCRPGKRTVFNSLARTAVESCCRRLFWLGRQAGLSDASIAAAAGAAWCAADGATT
eukprot:5298532-Pleurochrysis_carterae.AAC.1